MKPLSILVVDDLDATRDVVIRCLESRGHHVTAAAGGLQAMKLLESRVFDLVITDVVMPDADGVQVIMAARKAKKGTHVIVMSGGGDFFTAEQLLAMGGTLGAEAQLPKPFTVRQLIDTVQRVTGCGQEQAPPSFV
ncbi:response regulator [Opitutus sp. ER46]|uniref:response regulator n=1 Tax=Opitutus sp. ER46 TaxID=2161864 RepID=UPI000D311723|nr:response regulator [Opitutus sp. ER46]PTX91047.1 response regulator [Opitutus sp. ER46]